MTSYELSESPVLRVMFYDANGPHEPDTVTLRIRDPLGATIEADPLLFTTPGAGIREYILPLDEVGDWFYQWFASGPGPEYNVATPINKIFVLPALALV